MLVLNRRPGESIVIEPDLRVTVLSVADRRVWIDLQSSSGVPGLRISATVLSPDVARLEIIPMSSVVFEDGCVRMTPGSEGDPSTAVRAGLAVDRRPGERVEIADDLWVGIASVSKGNPSLTFGGKAIGDAFSITLIRPAGSYVRLGVDAPDRRVYREELWEMVQAAAETRERGGENGGEPAAVPPSNGDGDPVTAAVLASSPEEPSIPDPAVAALAADVTAGSAAG